jgi:hypothetical protein
MLIGTFSAAHSAYFWILYLVKSLKAGCHCKLGVLVGLFWHDFKQHDLGSHFVTARRLFKGNPKGKGERLFNSLAAVGGVKLSGATGSGSSRSLSLINNSTNSFK